jgi:peptide/nickel transport system substrate-binding protein
VKKITFLIMAIAALALFACDKTENNPAANSATPDPASTATLTEQAGEYKDSFILAITNDQDTLDPQWNVSNDKVLRMIYSGLLKREESGTIVGDIAESFSVGEDSLTWTFKLRSGLTFHDGAKLDAAAVKANYDRLLDTENPTRYTEQSTFIKECKVVDDLTLQLITVEPSGAFAANLMNLAHLIVNPAYIEQYGADYGKSAEAVCGSGPYKVTEWKKDEVMSFEAFEDYYDGIAATKTFSIMPITEPNARVIAVETGQVDIADGIPADELERLSSVDGLSVVKKPSVGQHMFQFNCSSPITGDARVRQAISYALDRPAIVDALYTGDNPCTAPLNPSTFGYYNFGVIERDLDKSKELLAEAGYSDGVNIKVMVTSVYMKGVEMGEMVKAQLAEAGIEVELIPVERAVFLASMDSHTPESYNETYGYDMFIMGAGPSSADAEGGLKRIYVTDPGGTNVNNYGFYSNAKVDELILAAGKETDQEKRKEIYKEAMQILYIDDPVGVWINDRYNTWVMSDKVENFGAGVTGVISFNKIAVKK